MTTTGSFVVQGEASESDEDEVIGHVISVDERFAVTKNFRYRQIANTV